LWPCNGCFSFLSAASFSSAGSARGERSSRWPKTFSLIENPELEARTYMYKVTRDMVADQPWYGHGAGSFRYLHFPYLAEYPEFSIKKYRWERNPETGKRERREITLWFQNAHVDLMEYLVEWGIVGCAFPVVLMLYLLGRAVWSHRGWDLGMFMILLSFFLVFGGAAVEFHLRIPLVLLVWWLTFLCLVRLGDLRARALAP
jgi:O-antigen ligase